MRTSQESHPIAPAARLRRARDVGRIPAPVEQQDRLARRRRASPRAPHGASAPTSGTWARRPDEPSARSSWARSTISTRGSRPPPTRSRSVHIRERAAGPVAFRPALQRGRRGAQHNRQAFELRTLDRDIAGVVSGELVLLVAAVVLLIHDDQAEVRERGEDRGSGPDNHTRLALGRPRPRVVPGGLAQPRVQHDHALVRESSEKPPGGLRRERDLRHQHDRRPARREHAVEQPEVDLGLARTRDAVQEVDAERARLDLGPDAIDRRVLLLGRVRRVSAVEERRVLEERVARAHAVHANAIEQARPPRGD